MSENFPFLKPTKNGVLLDVILSPRAKQNSINGLYQKRLKISISAPPVDGKANIALIRFLADTLQIGKSAISILKGETTRQKTLLIQADYKYLKDKLLIG